jgi:hypothetical protein
MSLLAFLEGRPYCPACESVLCGACGQCHSLDLMLGDDPRCPADEDTMGADCAAWFQSYKAAYAAAVAEESDI